MSRLSVGLALGAACGLLIDATPAAADDWSLHGLVNAQLGWTDNVFSAPDEPVPDAPLRESDFYTQITPGGLFTWETPRMIHELSYELTASLYLEHSEANSPTHRASWQAFWLTTPLSELSTGVAVSAGTLNGFSTTQIAQSGQVNVLPSARNDFFSVEARDAFNLQLTRAWRFTQTGAASYFSNEDPETHNGGTGIQVGGSLGFDRAWEFNAVGVIGQASLVSLEALNAGVAADGPEQLNTQLSVQWRRDLSLRWSSLVDGGITVLVPLDDGEVIPQPTLGAQLAYAPDWGAVSISVRRAMIANLFIAQNTINDSAAVNVALPLPWLADDPLQPKLSVQGGLGVGRTAIIDTADGSTDTSFNIFYGDLAVAYAMQPNLVFGLRYQYLRQIVDEGSLAAIYDYDRHTVLATFFGRWPSRVAANVPMRATLRVDRSNVTPVGEEVAPAGATGGGGR